MESKDTNKATRLQISRFLHAAYEKAKDPDQREVFRKKRLKRALKVSQKYGM